MELLDLALHDPEEYEGKLVVWKDCEYVVGPYLGSGAERITHKLINRASGLCLHVLKVWRQDLGYVPSQMRALLAAGRTPEFDFAKIIPVSIEIDIPAGKAEMQIYAGGGSDAESPEDALVRNADALLDESKPLEAVALYEQALRTNPNHTHALLNLAAARNQLGETAAAYELASKAKTVEPNFPLYRRACIEYLSAQGLGRLALDEFRAVQEDLPNVFDFNDVGAQLLLACGFPEEALVVAKECLLDAADKQALILRIEDALDRRAKASVFVREAHSLIQSADRHRIVELLEKARQLDSNDPLLATNLGLSLARAGRPNEATPLLLYAAAYGPLEWTKICYANAAFCAMDEKNLDGAMLLLDITMTHFDLELGGRQLENLTADLPGRGIWVDDRSIIEERIDTAARIVVESVNEFARHSAVTPNASRLARLYLEVGEH